MSMPSLIKIPEGSRRALPGALGCLCHPGPSFPVARGKPGVPAVQNEQGRKWDIQLKQCGARTLFAWDLDRFEDSATARPPIDPGPVPSAQKKFALHSSYFFGPSHFSNFLKLWKKVHLCPNRTSREDSTGRRPRRHPRTLPVDAQGHSRHFRTCPKKFPFSRKMRTGKLKKNHPVTNRIQRLPIGNKFIRHREPPQIRHP